MAIYSLDINYVLLLIEMFCPDTCVNISTKQYHFLSEQEKQKQSRKTTLNPSLNASHWTHDNNSSHDLSLRTVVKCGCWSMQSTTGRIRSTTGSIWSTIGVIGSSIYEIMQENSETNLQWFFFSFYFSCIYTKLI